MFIVQMSLGGWPWIKKEIFLMNLLQQLIEKFDHIGPSNFRGEDGNVKVYEQWTDRSKSKTN